MLNCRFLSCNRPVKNIFRKLTGISTIHVKSNICWLFLVSAQPQSFCNFSDASNPSRFTDFLPYEMIMSRSVSPNSKILRFSLPDEFPTLTSAGLPSGVKVKQVIEDTVLEKSYSPITPPQTQGYFDLLVKAYPPRQGGGLGSFLCDLSIGDVAHMRIKPPRKIHNEFYFRNRWKELGFVACGTGIAPFAEMISTILADPLEKTRLSVIYANRHEHDILLRKRLDKLKMLHSDRLRIYYTLSSPPPSTKDWNQGRGHVSVNMMRNHLPSPNEDTMIMVCGTDQFVGTVGGEIQRIKKNGKKKKIARTSSRIALRS